MTQNCLRFLSVSFNQRFLKAFQHPGSALALSLLGGVSLILAPSPLLAGDSPATLPLVVRSQAAAVILISEDASPDVWKSAELLQEYIRRSTGATLAIQTGQADGNSHAIHIGNTPYVQSLGLDLKDLGPQGFLHKKAGDNLVICGHTDQGTHYGVLEYLERDLGVRWLWPGDDGTVVPKAADLEIAFTERRMKPRFLMRQLSPLDWNGARWKSLKDWGALNRVAAPIAFHHSLFKIYNPKVFAKTNPEFYPWIDGIRMVPNPVTDSSGFSWQPNFSAPGIVETGAKHILEYFKKNPGQESFSLGINDARAFDQSPESLKRRSGETNSIGIEDVSDDYFQWARDVIELVNREAPGKLYGTLAYNNLFDPPELIKVHPQMVPFLTYDRMHWLRGNLREGDQQRTLRWAQTGAKLGWYDYTYGAYYRLPRVYFDMMGEYLRWAAENGVEYYYSEAYPNWSGEGPKAWLLMKLLWDPTRDVDALLNDWCRHAVGKEAAPFLKQYFRLWETFWKQNASGEDWALEGKTYCDFSSLEYLGAVSPALLNQADALLHEAARRTATDDEKARLQKITTMWQYYRDGVITYQAEEKGAKSSPTTEDEALALLAEAEQVMAVAAERKALATRFTIEEWTPNRFPFVSRWSRPNDPTWGFSLITATKAQWALSGRVRSKLEEMARGDSPASRYAGIALAAFENKGDALLGNPDFKGVLKPWKIVKRNEKVGDIAVREDGIHVKGPINFWINQSIPWTEGARYALVRFEVPEGALPPSSAQVTFFPEKKLQPHDDFKYVLPTVDLSVGKADNLKPKPGVYEKLVPLIVPPADGSFSIMKVSARIIINNPGEEIILKSIQLRTAP